MIDAKEEFHSFKQFIKDPAVISILKSYISDDTLQCALASVKNFNPKKQSTANNLIFSLDIIFEAIKPNTDELKKNATALQEIFPILKKKGAAVIPIYEEFAKSLDNLASKSAIEESSRLFNTLKQKIDENMKARVKISAAVESAREALDNGLQEVFTLNNIRERIFRIIENVKQEKANDESVSAIFHKRRRPECPSKFRVIPRTVSMDFASPEEKKMMDERKAAIEQIWKMAQENPRPYETIKRLEKENEKLKEDAELANLGPQEIEAMEAANEKLAQLVAQLREKITQSL